MIKHVLNLLVSMNHYGQTEIIEIAKGKYELPKTFKKGFNQIKRNWKWQRRK
jgi:hypothetical protein